MLLNSVTVWGTISIKYIQDDVKNVNEYFDRTCPGSIFLICSMGTIPGRYKHYTYTSPKLDIDVASFYKSQVGVLRCTVEMEQIYTIKKWSVLLS